MNLATKSDISDLRSELTEKLDRVLTQLDHLVKEMMTKFCTPAANTQCPSYWTGK